MSENNERKPIEQMTDREIAEETLATMRATQDLVEGFLAQFASGGGMGQVMSIVKMFSR